MSDAAEEHVNLQDLIFSANGAVGQGSDGHFYALSMSGDVYCKSNTRKEAQLKLEEAQRSPCW